MTQRSIRPERPVDPVTADIIAAVAAAAQAEGIDFMLVGAVAKDILLVHVLGLAPGRATTDIDFAVAVKDWQQFDALRGRLIASGHFERGTAPQHLRYHGDGGELPYRMDLVPFGAIADTNNEIAWPPDMKVVMNMAGYDDALAAAEVVSFAPGVEGKVVSLAGLAILKLVAWSDRGRGNPRDADDLIYLIEHYTAAGNNDRVYEEDGVIDAAGYDPDLAGAYLLGMDMQRLASAATLEVITCIIERDFDRLANDMVRAMRHYPNVVQRVDSRLRLLRRALAPAAVRPDTN